MAENEELFAYAAGTVDAPTRQRIERALAEDAGLRARLRWYEAVCDGLIARLPEPQRLPSADEVLARTRSAGRPRGGFFAWLSGAPLKPVAAVAAGVLIAQAAVIGVLTSERLDAPATRSTGTVSGSTVFVVAFAPDTPEAKIRVLLLEAGAVIVDGPRQLGDYRVAVPANRAGFARQLFEESRIVEYVRLEEERKR